MVNSRCVAFLSFVILFSGCGGSKSNDTITVKVPESAIVNQSPKLNSLTFYALKNTDGTYSTFVGSWIVPPNVKFVKIIGCSGGNGGGGGGAGGAGAKFFSGNWAGSSWGGNGSAGGGANGINNSGEAGQIGLVGKIRRNSLDPNWYDAGRYGGGYHQANSATQPGSSGKEGELTIFGKYIFSFATENKNNLNNISKHNINYENICLGGSGGRGGLGGEGGTSGLGGVGGRGGYGKFGFNSLVEETDISVIPGETIFLQVGRGGEGGSRSTQIVEGQRGERSIGENGKNGNLGSNGAAGKPGFLLLQWIGY